MERGRSRRTLPQAHAYLFCATTRAAHRRSPRARLSSSHSHPMHVSTAHYTPIPVHLLPYTTAHAVCPAYTIHFYPWQHHRQILLLVVGDSFFSWELVGWETGNTFEGRTRTLYAQQFITHMKGGQEHFATFSTVEAFITPVGSVLWWVIGDD